MKAKPKATEAPAKVSKAELSELYRMTDAQFTAWQGELSRSLGQKLVGASGYRGVSRNRNKWQARTNHGGVNVHIGYFESKREAARAHDRVSLARRGRNALINFHPRNYVSPEGDLLPAEGEQTSMSGEPSSSETE